MPWFRAELPFFIEVKIGQLPQWLRTRGGQHERNAGRIYTPGGCIIPVTWGAYSRLKGFIVACDRRPQGLISYKPLLPPRQMLTVSCSSTRPPQGCPHHSSLWMDLMTFLRHREYYVWPEVDNVKQLFVFIM